MTPDEVLTAARSINQVEEIGTWFPSDGTKPVYLHLGNVDPEGHNKDAGRLLLRLDRKELEVVITALLDHHEGILAKLGVRVVEPNIAG